MSIKMNLLVIILNLVIISFVSCKEPMPNPPIENPVIPSKYILINDIKNTDTDFQALNNNFGKASGKDIPVGAGFIISYLNASSAACVNTLNSYLALSEKYDVPLLIQLDGESWWDGRPDLWNWWDASAPGYNPANKENVEWTSWSSNDAVKIGWRNWGRQLRVKPMPNLMSPVYRAATHKQLNVLIPIVVNWWKKLKTEKKYLLVGVKLGWESSIGVNNWYYPNGNSLLTQPESNDPMYGTNVNNIPSRGVTTIGYAAVKTAGIATSGTITGAMQAEVVRRHLEDWCKLASEKGIPRDRLFTHCGAWALGEDNYASAVNQYSCPGWSFYEYAYDPAKDVTAMNVVKASNAPYWAATEWLFQGTSNQTNWANALRKTLIDANSRYVCIFNWQDVLTRTGALDAVREVSKTKLTIK
jgi:hypothetical protein